MPLTQLAGKIFGRLTVLPLVRMKPTMWLCRCSCGTELYVRAHTLKSGDSKSCGCLQKELAKAARTTHGMKLTREWQTWIGMKDRCKPFSKDASRYANRGISVCERWDSFENFFADMGNRPEGMSIERVDNNKGYSPENCVWASRITQGRNTRANKFITFNGLTQTQSAWAAQLGVDDTVIMRRIKAGWPIATALTAPVNRGVRHKPKATQ